VFAAADQVVTSLTRLYTSPHRPDLGRLLDLETSGSWDLDWTRPWTALVRTAHQAARDAAARREPDSAVVDQIEWMDWVDV
jgi:hypothetical protein